MRRSTKPSYLSPASYPADSLVPPAVRGVTLGFIGGLIAILAITLLIPGGSTQQARKGEGATATVRELAATK